MKPIFTIALFLLGINSFAQQLTPKEKTAFDDIAYNSPTGNTALVIQKWVVPIRYKVYGNPDAYISKEIDTTFNQLKQLTSLDIQKTDDDDEANFILVFGRQEKDLKMLSAGIMKYMNDYGAFQYRSNNKSEIYRAENLLFPESYASKADIRAAIKRNIVKSLGLLKPTESAAYSIFYSNSNNKLKIDLFDAHVIAAFYAENIKAGMSKEKADAVITVVK